MDATPSTPATLEAPGSVPSGPIQVEMAGRNGSPSPVMTERMLAIPPTHSIRSFVCEAPCAARGASRVDPLSPRWGATRVSSGDRFAVGLGSFGWAS